jgi:hypothetical protein
MAELKIPDPPTQTTDAHWDLWVHVVEWLSREQFIDDPDRSTFPVGWVQVYRNPRFGFHFTKEGRRISFRRPGDAESHPALIDAWKLIGDLPGNRRGQVAFAGSDKVDCGSP